jgi:hypothetical protein
MDALCDTYIDMMADLVAIIIIRRILNHIQAYYERLPRNRPPRETETIFQAWIRRGHSQACLDQYRMPIETFLRLNEWLVLNAGLKDSRYVSAMQKLAMFLRICGHGLSQRTSIDVFQHSGSTISR